MVLGFFGCVPEKWGVCAVCSSGGEIRPAVPEIVLATQIVIELKGFRSLDYAHPRISKLLCSGMIQRASSLRKTI